MHQQKSRSQQKSRLAQTILACLLAVSLFALQLACGPPPREKLVKIAGFGQILEAQLEANSSLPEQLYTEHVIDEATRARLDTIFVSARMNVKAFNHGMEAALAEEKPDLGSLVTVVAALIGNVQSLHEFNNPKFNKTLTVIEISLRGIASYFALQTKTASASGLSDSQMARALGLPEKRGARALAVIEAYAAS